MSVLDRFDLTGRVAVVTGGSRGIGRMIATGLLEAGARVWICSRSAQACEETAEELAGLGEVRVAPADLSDYAGALRLRDQVAAEEDAVAVLVNNAGAAWGADVEDFPEHGFDKVLDLNLKGLFATTQAFLPLLRAATGDDTTAAVLNIGSVDGIRVPHVENYSYSAAKAGVHQLTRHLAKRLGDDRIRVNAIAPGLFPSKMTAHMIETAGEEILARTPLRRSGRPDDAAAAAVYLCSEASSFVTGAVLVVDGGVTAT